MKPVADLPASGSLPEAAGNRYDRTEWAGAFGDLGTLIPFVIAYLAVLKMDPFGVLLAFGLAMIATGLYYRTPVPVQPMKAIGAVATTQAAQTFAITPQAVYAGGLATGVIWLLLGATGLAQKVARVVPRPIAVGIVLGLGFGFMIEGLKMMALAWPVAAAGLILTLLLLSNRTIPAMLVLMVFGVGCAVLSDPALLEELTAVRMEVRLPEFALSGLTIQDLLGGLVFLALPQIPLTFGNAILGITEENNRQFPDKPVTERKVAVSTGLMNIAGAALGGVPMCHGAGGMAGHTRFGARTGGAVVILGTLLCFIAVFFSSSVMTLLKLFPLPVLGVVLFLTGAQLALGSCDFSRQKDERFATLVTAGCAAWNVGIAFVLGWALLALLRRGWVRL